MLVCLPLAAPIGLKPVGLLFKYNHSSIDLSVIFLWFSILKFLVYLNNFEAIWRLMRWFVATVGAVVAVAFIPQTEHQDTQ